jgi:hypothetical protein
MTPPQLQQAAQLALSQMPAEPAVRKPKIILNYRKPKIILRHRPNKPKIILHHNPNKDNDERGIIIERIGNTRRIRVTIREEVLARKGLPNPFKKA